MRLGISSHAYGWAIGVPGHAPPRPLSPLDLLDRADELGARVVQVADNLPMHALAEAEIVEFAARARQLGIAIELGICGIDRETTLPYVRMANDLRASILRTVVDTVAHQLSADEIVDSICQLVPHLEQANVVLAVENHDRIQVGQLARIMERIGSRNVGICLDTVNSFGALEGPGAVVDALAPWTVNLHLKEFAVRRVDHRMGFTIEGRPLGDGRLDVPWLLTRLRELGRDPNAILEQWTPPADSLEMTIAREADWVRQSFAYARSYIKE